MFAFLYRHRMSPYLEATLIPVLTVSAAAGFYFGLSFALRDDYTFCAYLPGYLFTRCYLVVKCCSMPSGFNGKQKGPFQMEQPPHKTRHIPLTFKSMSAGYDSRRTRFFNTI